VGKCDFIRQLAVFQCQKNCHQLCDAGRIHFFVCILIIENFPACRIYQNGGFCGKAQRIVRSGLICLRFVCFICLRFFCLVFFFCKDGIRGKSYRKCQ